MQYEYEKKRAEFGHHCAFEDQPTLILESIPSSKEYDADYVKRNPCVTTIDITPMMAEHEAQTDRVLRKNHGMLHVEGGWPENVDASEADQVDRYLKKANKDTKYKQTVISLASSIETVIKQNNTVDVYEEYFDASASGGAGTATGGAGAADGIDLSSEPPSAKGLAVYRDPSLIKRTATAINWHPEGSKIAVAYSVLKFQDERLMSGRLPTSSYVWDIAYPNSPLQELSPPSPLVSLRYNVKTPDVLIGGCYNGMVAVFDVKKPRGLALQTSPIDKSHHDPVYDVYWIQSKTNTQFVSVSTDGQMMWWDIKKLTEPTEVLQLSDATGRVLGGSSLEYNVEAGPAKYLVGTEQGTVLSLNMRKRGGKGGSDAGMIQAQEGKHHGPIYSIHRNPVHPSAAYLTVGDWTARIWSEKNKNPILMTPYCKAYLTAGCWSPTRAGVFYTCRADGVLDVWDLCYRQTAAAYSHKVADHPLSSISVQGSVQAGGGRLIAVGNTNGTVSLLEVSESLAVPQASEKAAIGALFERESKREDTLEARAKQLARLAKPAKAEGGDGAGGGATGGGEKDDGMEEILRRVDTEFMTLIKQAEEEESKEDRADAMAGMAGGAAGSDASAMTGGGGAAGGAGSSE